MQKINLTQGFIALIDDEDYERVSKFKWRAHKTKTTIYAKRSTSRLFGPRKIIFLHRFIFGVNDKRRIDHRDRNGLNCQKRNMRICTHAQNLANRGPNINNSSGYKGVTWDKKRNKWVAFIKINYHLINLGGFTDPIRAARAYDSKACKLFGEFAWLNFP